MNYNDYELTPEDGFRKLCACGCGEYFYTRNRKRKFKNKYHKHYHHYSLKLLNMKNQLELDKGNYENFKVVRDSYEMGFREMSPDALAIRGYNPNFAPIQGEADGLPALIYNNYALIMKPGSKFITIQKISSWRK